MFSVTFAPAPAFCAMPEMVWSTKDSTPLRKPSPKIGSTIIPNNGLSDTLIVTFALVSLPLASDVVTPITNGPSVRDCRKLGSRLKLNLPSAPTVPVNTVPPTLSVIVCPSAPGALPVNSCPNSASARFRMLLPAITSRDINGPVVSTVIVCVEVARLPEVSVTVALISTCPSAINAKSATGTLVLHLPSPPTIAE